MSLNIPTDSFFAWFWNWFQWFAILVLFAVGLNIEHYREKLRLTVMNHVLSSLPNMENPQDYKNIWKSERRNAEN